MYKAAKTLEKKIKLLHDRFVEQAKRSAGANISNYFENDAPLHSDRLISSYRFQRAQGHPQLVGRSKTYYPRRRVVYIRQV